MNDTFMRVRSQKENSDVSRRVLDLRSKEQAGKAVARGHSSRTSLNQHPPRTEKETAGHIKSEDELAPSAAAVETPDSARSVTVLF